MADLLLDLILVSCIGLVAVGAGLIYMPAGLIAGGLLGLVALLIYLKGAARDRTADRPGP